MSERLRLEYVPLHIAAGWDWVENPKTHDIGGLVQSITEYGFRDPPEFDAALDAFAQGNGRVKALAMMMLQGYERPKYIGTDEEDGHWAVPVLFGADSDSEAMARAFAIDANNLVLTGGDTELWDILSMYDRQQLADIAVALETDGQPLVTLDDASLSLIAGNGSGEEPDLEAVERWSFQVHYEAPRALLDELVDLMGPYFMPYSRRKLAPEFFTAMVRSYCAKDSPMVLTDD